MLKRAIGLLVVVLAAGCMSEMGGPSTSITPTGCIARSGLYRLHFVQTNGTCGVIPDIVVNIDDPVTTGCAFTEKTTENGCHAVRTTTCNDPVLGASKTTFTATINASATHVDGTLFLQTDTCASTYATTWDTVR